MTRTDATQALREAIEVPRTATLWGSSHRIVPALIDEVFGDGRQLAFLEPINSRPNFYVVRVDSTWSADGGGGRPTLGDHADAILAAARNQWGDSWPEEGSGRRKQRPWPAVPTDDGCSWGFMDWPDGSAPEPDGIDLALAELAVHAPQLAELEPHCGRRLMKAALHALELHLDPRSAPALQAAASAGAAAVRRDWPDAAAALSDSDVMRAAVSAALGADPSLRRLRLVGIPGTSVVDGAASRISIFEAPAGLGATAILALSAEDPEGGLPGTHLVARTERGPVPISLVCADLRLDTARDPWKLRPGAFAALGEIRVSDGGSISAVPCDGIALRVGELPAEGFAREAAVALGYGPEEASPAPRP